MVNFSIFCVLSKIWGYNPPPPALLCDTSCCGRLSTQLTNKQNRDIKGVDVVVYIEINLDIKIFGHGFFENQ